MNMESQHKQKELHKERKWSSISSSTPLSIPPRPYLMDLDSTNGTYLNGERIEGGRYIELLSDDIIRFGFSTRNYIISLLDVNPL